MGREAAKWKKQVAKDITELVRSNPVVGIVNIKGIPAMQFQEMRGNLRGKLQLIVAKNNLLDMVLKEMEKEKKGISNLCTLVDGQAAIVGAKDNPFKLYKIMEKTKTKMAARGGEISPMDISVSAGETPFKPGPIVGEMQKAGIPAAIEGGKVIIKKDKMLVKTGEPISSDVARMLSKLDIMPLTVGMDLKGVYEAGMVFKSDVLAIDETKFRGQLSQAIGGAYNLAYKIAYTNKLTIKVLISKAQRDAMSVALSAGISNKDTIEQLLAMANSKMLALASKVPDAADEQLKGMLGAAQQASAQPAQAAQAQKPAEKKEEKKASETEVAAGLGALFG
jgi:large subunit ribosomal protein L10